MSLGIDTNLYHHFYPFDESMILFSRLHVTPVAVSVLVVTYTCTCTVHCKERQQSYHTTTLTLPYYPTLLPFPTLPYTGAWYTMGGEPAMQQKGKATQHNSPETVIFQREIGCLSWGLNLRPALQAMDALNN